MNNLPSNNAPCKGCPDRYLACSDHCQKPEFLEWRRNVEERRKMKIKLAEERRSFYKRRARLGYYRGNKEW